MVYPFLKLVLGYKNNKKTNRTLKQQYKVRSVFMMFFI